MTSNLNRINGDYSSGNSTEHIELQERKGRVPTPVAQEVPQEKDIHAVHFTTEQKLVLVLQKIKESPELFSQFVEELDIDDPLHQATKELLSEDLTASTLIIQNEKNPGEWLTDKNEEYNRKKVGGWLDTEKPAPAWKYSYLVAKPARAIWWTGNSIYKVWQVANTIIVPIGVCMTVLQSPWTPVLMLLLKKLVR